MQVTIEIDDVVLAAVRELAESQKKSSGEVLSDLARETLRSYRHFDEDEDRGFPVFRVSADAPALTGEMVKRAL